MPTVRTCLVEGEPLKLTAVVLGAQPSQVAVYWRPLGTGEFARVPMEHVARGVFRVTLSSEATRADLEYYIQAEIKGRGINSEAGIVGALAGLQFPPTAPKLNQTVVVVPADGT